MDGWIVIPNHTMNCTNLKAVDPQTVLREPNVAENIEVKCLEYFKTELITIESTAFR